MKLLQNHRHFEPARNFSGAWVTPAGAANAGLHVIMRREFSVNKTGTHMLHLCVLGEYEVFLNGERLYIGGIPRQLHHLLYDSIQIEGLLRKGRNILAIHAMQTRTPMHGVLCDLVDEDGTVVVSSDEDWRASWNHGWRDGEEPLPTGINMMQEVLDARRHPEGWQYLDFDDGRWPHMRLAPKLDQCQLVPRSTALPEELTVRPESVVAIDETLDVCGYPCGSYLAKLVSSPGQAITFSQAEGVDSLLEDSSNACFAQGADRLEDGTVDGLYAPSVLLDFGRVHTGFLEIDIEGASGSVLEIGYHERLVAGHMNINLCADYADRYILRDGQQTFASTNWKGFRYIRLRFSDCGQAVRVSRVACRVCRYPFKERGGFLSNDETLNGVFNMCRYTMRLCTRDFIMDTPWRERSQWVGDAAAVIIPGLYACFGDEALAGQFLRQAAACQLPQGPLCQFTTRPEVVVEKGRFPDFKRSINEYSLWWIHGVWEYFQRTGDERYIHACYPVIQRIMAWYLDRLDQHGLLDVPCRVFIDHVFKPDSGIIAPLVALLQGTMAHVQAMAAIIGDATSAQRYERIRQTVSENFLPAFFDEEQGVFRDLHCDGAPAGGISEHANFAAILWGLCPDDVASSIVERFYERADIDYLETNPFFAVVVLRALTSIDRRDIGLRLIRERWGKRWFERGYASTPEEWSFSASRRGPNNEPRAVFRSASHAWSACPAEWLTANLIGLEIVTPGCPKITIAPHRSDLDYEVRYPLPQGPLIVRCHAQEITVNAPDGVEVGTVG